MRKRPTIAYRINEMTTEQRRRAYHWAREFCIRADPALTPQAFDAWARREAQSPRYHAKRKCVALGEVALRRAVTLVSRACRNGRYGMDAADLVCAKALQEAA